ncbi:hypothetical protein CYMTET_35098, partial [Cymbomonas tetramitiformis]
ANWLHVEMATMLLVQHQWAAARSHLEVLVAQKPERCAGRSYAALLMGACFAAEGDFTEARRWFLDTTSTARSSNEFDMRMSMLATVFMSRRDGMLIACELQLHRGMMWRWTKPQLEACSTELQEKQVQMDERIAALEQAHERQLQASQRASHQDMIESLQDIDSIDVQISNDLHVGGDGMPASFSNDGRSYTREPALEIPQGGALDALEPARPESPSGAARGCESRHCASGDGESISGSMEDIAKEFQELKEERLVCLLMIGTLMNLRGDPFASEMYFRGLLEDIADLVCTGRLFRSRPTLTQHQASIVAFSQLELAIALFKQRRIEEVTPSCFSVSRPRLA